MEKKAEQNASRAENRIKDPFWDYYEDLVLHTVLP